MIGVLLGFIAALALLLSGCHPEARRARFDKQVLTKLDLPEVIVWARAQLDTHPENYLVPRTNFPPSLARAKPVLVDVGVLNTQTGDRFLLIAFVFGLEREGLMIGKAGAQINNPGYRYQITNGVYYVLDHN